MNIEWVVTIKLYTEDELLITVVNESVWAPTEYAATKRAQQLANTYCGKAKGDYWTIEIK